MVRKSSKNQTKSKSKVELETLVNKWRKKKIKQKVGSQTSVKKKKKKKSSKIQTNGKSKVESQTLVTKKIEVERKQKITLNNKKTKPYWQNEERRAKRQKPKTKA